MNFKPILALLFSASLLVSCENTPTDVDIPENAEITFSAAVNSRATDTAFESGDEISVTAYDASGATYAQDVKYSYMSSLFSSSTPIEYTSTNSELSFCALYPYVEMPDDKKVYFAVKSDQSSDSAYALSDLMLSAVSLTSSTTPTLTFNHLLSKVVFTVVSADVDMTSAEATIDAVVGVDYDLSNSSLTLNGDATTITMADNGTNSYKAIIIPQTITADIPFGCISVGGEDYKFYAESDFDMLDGKEYTINATIKDGEITFDEPIIKEWNDDTSSDDETSKYATVITLPSTGGVVDSNPDTFIPNYMKPEATFSVYLDEIYSDVTYTGSSVAELQAMIDQARTAAADEDLVMIYLQGEIVVEDTSLSLPHHSVLCFEGGNARIIASDTATASELLKIEDATHVGLKRVAGTTSDILFDGNGVVNCGINIVNSGKVTIEEAKIVNCKEYGIDATGTGADNDPCDVIAVVLSTITDCPEAGIRIQEAANPILSNNTIKDCGIGMNIYALSPIMQYNTLSDNNVGIFYDAVTASVDPAGLISRNTLKDNVSTGIELTNNCERTMILENDIDGSSTGIVADGQYNRILANDLGGNTTSYAKGATRGWNNVIQNSGVSNSDNVGSRYFNPPTISNPHNEAIRESVSRADLTITQDESDPFDMVEVQSRIDAFVAENPSAHVVVWLNGEFVSKTSNIALKLSSDISIVLDGRIYAAPEDGKTIQESAMYSNYNGRNVPDVELGYSKNYEDGNTIMVSINTTSDSSYVSFSGGEVDCQSMACWGFFTPSESKDGTIVIDEVSVKSAAYNNIAPLSHANAGSPVVVRNCYIDGTYIGDEGFTNTFRGVWLHVAQYLYVIGNTSYNHEADAFDVDAYAHNTMTLYNKTTDENRFGVFVEEGASRNVVVGNLFRQVDNTNDNAVGYGMYCSDVTSQGHCSNNVVAFNTATNTNSYRFRYAQYTVSFNNRVPSGKSYGVYLNALDNYSGQINMNDTFRYDTNTFPYNNAFFTMP